MKNYCREIRLYLQSVSFYLVLPPFRQMCLYHLDFFTHLSPCSPQFSKLPFSLLFSMLPSFSSPFSFWVLFIISCISHNLENLDSLFREMTLKGGTSQACAACKYQRRKCTQECPLAPYFPSDQPKIFQNAHKLFGVSNMLKILNKLDPAQKKEAMTSIIYQANVRDRFPVHGCLAIIQQLWAQIRRCEEELDAVYTMLVVCGQRHHTSTSPMDSSSSLSQLQLGMMPMAMECSVTSSSTSPTPCYSNDKTPQSYAAAPISHIYSQLGGDSTYYSNYFDQKEDIMNCSIRIQQQNPYVNNYDDNNNNSIIQSQLVASQQPLIQQEFFQDYDKMKPYFDTIDDRQSYIDSKAAYDSSPESSVKDATIQSIEHVAENELKSAAARFSLTSVN